MTATKLRALTVVNIFIREDFAIDVGRQLKGGARGRGPESTGAPTGRTETPVLPITARSLLVSLSTCGLYHHGLRIDFSRPGKPTDNAFIETVNGSLLDDRRMRRSDTLTEARSIIGTWRRDYNESQPHMALGYRTPQDIYCREALPG